MGLASDKLFYWLFQTRPDRIVPLLDDLPADAGGYRFMAPVLKAREYRLDGLFLPPADRPELPAPDLRRKRTPDSAGDGHQALAGGGALTRSPPQLRRSRTGGGVSGAQGASALRRALGLLVEKESEQSPSTREDLKVAIIAGDGIDAGIGGAHGDGFLRCA